MPEMNYLDIDESQMGMNYQFTPDMFCATSYNCDDDSEYDSDESCSLMIDHYKKEYEKKKNDKKDEDNKKEEPKFSQTENGKTIKILLDNFTCFKKLSVNYTDWFPVVCAIYNSVENKKECYDLIHHFSKLCIDKYDRDDVDKEVKKICEREGYNNKKKTIGSLIYYAKNENGEKYKTLFGKKSKTKVVETSDVDNKDTDYYLATAFNKQFGKYFKMVDIPSKTLYYWNKQTGFWVLDTGLSSLRNMISTEFKKIYDDKLVVLLEELKEITNEDLKAVKTKIIEKVSKIIKKVETTADKNNICREIFDLVLDVNFEEQLNSNPYLFAFNNCVMDLKTLTSRKLKYDDYISWSAGYDYVEEKDETIKKDLLDLLSKIQPETDVRNLVLQIISKGFYGEAIEKFVIFNGGGGNGKGLLDEFVEMIFGDYCYIYAPVCLLTDKDKTGPNPEKYKINKKRIMIMKEPSGDIKLKNDRVREITGGGNISGRDLYSGANKCRIELKHLLIMECNSRPLFESDPEDAEVRRIIDILFPNKFTTNETEVNNIDVFKADPLYKTMEWKQKHRNAFVGLLLDAYKQLQKNNYTFTIPKCVQDRTDEYINKSFAVLTIFKNMYVKTGNPKDIIKLKDVCENIKNSDEYNHLNKADKRKYNTTYMYEFIEKHKLFRDDYHLMKRIDGILYKNILTGYSLLHTGETDDEGN